MRHSYRMRNKYHHEAAAIVNPSKLVMTLLVRNEEDIIRLNIDFHLSKGVDFIIATDNGSTDSTRDILREYEEKGLLHLIDEKTHNHNQAEWNNRMAKIARDQYSADIIFHCDADEFWHPQSGNLKEEISNRPEDILIVDVINIIPMDQGGDEAFPEDTKFAVVTPVVAKDYQVESGRTNMFYLKYPPKVIFKSKDKMLLVSEGNHAITNKDDSIKEGISNDIVIYHYPIRSKGNFFQKTIQAGSAYENSDIHSKDTGFHKRQWYDSYRKGLLDETYKKLLIPEGEIGKFIFEGFIEEIDFNNIILGHENSDDRWRFFNRRFEYEDELQDFFWAWAGHKLFGYDLIRNVKPQTIVELGTHRGTSFFSFCQAVKDARYNANLCAVDTWRGDEHAGFYDENVFKEVNEIKEKYYGSLKIKLLRKTFDEAAREFENNSIDLLHIDGIHTYEAAKHDFETWLPKVKKEGIILLHDIFINRDDFGVYKFWEDLKRKYKTIEFHHSYGLGVLFQDSVRSQTFMDSEREWQIRYSYLAEEKKNEEIRKAFNNPEKALAERDEQIAALYHSTSWRMTRPLRLIGQALKRFRHIGLRKRLACFLAMTYRSNGEPKVSQARGEEQQMPDTSTGKPLVLEEALSKTLAEILEVIQSRIVKDSTYFGIPCQRSPLDFWIYQETIFALKPDVIVEIGNYCGGSALSLAHLCDHLGKGRVIAVDIDHSQLNQTAKKHPRISFVTGDACEVFDEVAAMCCGAAVVMVIEDSSHEFQNTLNVLKKYSQLVTVGSYLIVEDSICHHGLNTGPKPGPYEAISEFLGDYQNFHIDRKKEAFLITWNPKGYLIRIE